MTRARLQTAWDRLLASDPGLSRLIRALEAGLAIGVAIAVQYGFAQLAHPLWNGPSAAQHHGVTLLTILLGGIVSMILTIGVSDPTPREQTITLTLAPVPMLAAMAGAIALSGHLVPGLAVLTLVTGLGTWARALRPLIGPRAFVYGMLLFMGYFFGFLAGADIPLREIGWLAAVLWLAVLVNLGLRLAIFNPLAAGAVARGRLSFAARARRVIEATAAVLGADEHDGRRRRRRLRRALTALNEHALILDAQLGDPRVPLTAASAERIHVQLFELELDLDNLARATGAAQDTLPPQLRALAHDWVIGLRHGDTTAPRAAIAAARSGQIAAELSDRGRDVGYALAVLVVETDEALTRWREDRPPSEPVSSRLTRTADLYESPVALFADNLAGSSQASRAALDPATSRGLAARLRLDANAQNALRVMIAVGVASAVAGEISPRRFYWAVIAVFISFMGANTASEQLVKALNRVVGTLLGILIGSLLAQAIGISTWSLAVVLPAMMIGIYFQRVSYALMSAGITTTIAMLYVQLGEYSGSLLALRLELTALGCLIAMLAALFVFPVRTKRVVRQASLNVLEALRTLLDGVPRALGTRGSGARPTADSRALDDAMQQLLTTARPLAREPWSHHDLRHNLGLLKSAGHFARNLAAAVDAVHDPGEELRERVTRICSLEVGVIDRLSEAIRSGSPVAPGEGPLGELADASRLLAEDGVARDDPRQRALRALARLDGTLDRLARALSDVDPDAADVPPAPGTGSIPTPTPAPGAPA